MMWVEYEICWADHVECTEKSEWGKTRKNSAGDILRNKSLARPKRKRKGNKVIGLKEMGVKTC